MLKKATGGNAAAFIEKTGELIKQLDQMQGHRVVWTNTTGGVTISYHFGDRTAGGHDSATQSKFTGAKIESDGVNGTPRFGNETRPENYTIKLWLRTA